jgi:hypothetical protein
MNKKILIVIGLLLLLGGVGAYLFASKGKSPSTATPQEQATSGESSAQRSLKDLLGLGTSQECLFSTEGSNGVVYVAGGKVRGDFTTESEGQTTISHMIVDGQTSYVWMEGQQMGYKFSFDESAQVQDQDQGQTSQATVDIDQKVDYNCKSWNTDPSMFTLPAGIEFSDMSQLTAPAGEQTSEDTKAAQCAACDSAPEDAREQCRAALGCN